MSPEEMRARHPLISNSPKYRQYLAEKAAREIVQRLLKALGVKGHPFADSERSRMMIDAEGKDHKRRATVGIARIIVAGRPTQNRKACLADSFATASPKTLTWRGLNHTG